jgi:hypothetical protein
MKFEVDLSDADLVYILNDKGAFGPYGAPEGQKIGRQIRDQLPPPRMTEPGQVQPQVIASVPWYERRRGWIHVGDYWLPVDDPDAPERWNTLIDPEPVDGES